MMERLGYGGGDDHDYEDDFQEDYEESNEEDFEPENPGDCDALENFEEGFREQVEHEVDYDTDDIKDLEVNRKIGWRGKANRAKWGRFEPPDMTKFAGPAFVRLADLKIRKATPP